MQAFVATNAGFAASYGNDDATHLACDRISEVLEADAEVFFVFNGTAANSIALALLRQSYQAVICSDTAHVETNECGAPDFFQRLQITLSPAPHRTAPPRPGVPACMPGAPAGEETAARSHF
jgi:threonine aldolase